MSFKVWKFDLIEPFKKVRVIFRSINIEAARSGSPVEVDNRDSLAELVGNQVERADILGLVDILVVA
jgi:hypothetical protein